MSFERKAASVAMVCCLVAIVATPVAQADFIIHDFQDGTFGPWTVGGGLTSGVGPDSEPDFAGDQVGFVSDPSPSFQTVLQISTSGVNGALLQALHANDTIEWEVDAASYGGDFLNNHVVFQTNLPAPLGGFNVLAGSARGFAATTDDQLYSYNFDLDGDGEGRAILNAIDPDKDGFIEAGLSMNIFIIQQAGGSTANAVAYDDFILRRVIPEPSSVVLLGTGAILAGVVGCRRRSRRS